MLTMKTTDAIKIFGNAAKLAAALGIRRAAVSQWGDDVPPLRAYQIKEIVDRQHEDGQACADDKLAA